MDGKSNASSKFYENQFVFKIMLGSELAARTIQVKVNITWIDIGLLLWFTAKGISYESFSFTCKQHHACSTL